MKISEELTKSIIKSVKSDNLKRNKKDNTESDSEKEFESDSESESDTDTDTNTKESQLNKLGISKSDLVKIDANIKDHCVHWYHPTNKNVYSYNMKEHGWKKDKKKLKEFFEDEIEQIEKNLKNLKTQSK